MERAIGSKINLKSEDNSIAIQYQKCVADIIYSDRVKKLDSFSQHLGTSRLQHSINVSYYSFVICRALRFNYRAAARAGLLHDFFYYDWRVKKAFRTYHASWHPRVALDNASKITELSKIEKDAILKHMWPCTLVPPKYKESIVVSAVDKVCTVFEATDSMYKKYSKA